jgi:hypothetical protein
MMTALARRWTRKRLVVLAAFVAVAAYVLVAIWIQPAASGSNEAFTGIPGHSPTKEAVDIGVGVTQETLVWPYVDGGVITLVTSIANRGPVGLTITGVETNGRPPDWAGLFTLTDARAAVLANPGQCCELNESATWSARDFRPIYVDPGHEGVVAAHILMSNCEYNRGGGWVAIAYIHVDYTVLGFHHVQEVGVGPYWMKSPGTCPRPRAA